MNLDNELVNQKNHLLELVADEKFEEAITILEFVAELWAKCNYAYKTKEIRTRIRDKIQAYIFNANHHKTVEKWQKLLAKC